MRNYIVLIFILLNTIAFGQKDSSVFFDEFSVSINRTNLNDHNTNDRLGFGLGAYHTFRSDKTVNILFGFEFNRTSQFKETIYEGRFSHATDITYFLNDLSIPLTVRLNTGNRINIFCETGLFADINLGSRRKGKMHTYYPIEIPNNGNYIFDYKESEFVGAVKVSRINYGFSIGIGINVPISKFNIIIKPDYKHGLKALYDYHDQIFNRYFRVMIGIEI